MTASNDISTYVITTDAVRRAIKALESLSIHEHFAGYLSVLRSVSKSTDPVQSKAIWDFHRDYLQAKKENGKVVFVSPFASRGSAELHIISDNLAGSYGPSSVREGKALASVLDVHGTGVNAIYSLKNNHARLASEKLLKKSRVPVISLALFLYRDHGLHLETREISRILDLFRREFGLTENDHNGDINFEILFENDEENFGPDDLQLVREF